MKQHAPFSLEKTLKSGHIFAYDEIAPQTFRIINHDKAFIVHQKKNGTLECEGISEEEVHQFFDIQKNFDFLKDNFELKNFEDIRLVRQELRQAILTFIMTANNNQKRIKGMMDRFRALHPKQHIPKTFTKEQLEAIGFGYRAKSMALANEILTKNFLENIKQSEYETQRELLLSIPGVGPKVADCIMAYSELANPYAFPLDVWVMRAVQRRHKLKNNSYEYIRAFAKKRFGKDASYIQHYYFLSEQETYKGEKNERTNKLKK